MKKNRKVTRESQFPKAKEALRALIDELADLMERMGNEGRQPNEKEMSLLRMAYAPVLDEVLADLKVQFIATGYIDAYELQWFSEFDNNIR